MWLSPIATALALQPPFSRHGPSDGKNIPSEGGSRSHEHERLGSHESSGPAPQVRSRPSPSATRQMRSELTTQPQVREEDRRQVPDRTRLDWTAERNRVALFRDDGLWFTGQIVRLPR